MVFIYRQHDCVKNVKDDTIKLRQPISESIRIQGHSTKITEFMYTGQKKKQLGIKIIRAVSLEVALKKLNILQEAYQNYIRPVH